MAIFKRLWFRGICGSLGILVLGVWFSAVHSNRADDQYASEQGDDDVHQSISSFECGLTTAALIAGLWVYLLAMEERKHPKRSPNLRAPEWDPWSGQLVQPTFILSKGGKYPWVACVRHTSSKSPHLVELEAHIREGGNVEEFDDDVHILAYRPAGPEQDPFGRHDFSHSCYCSPTIFEQVYGRKIIIHSEDSR